MDSRLRNNAFVSWRLASGAVASEDVVALPGPVVVNRSEDTSFVAACNSALHNHLSAQPSGALYSFHAGVGGATALWRLLLHGQGVAYELLCGERWV